MKKVAQLGLFLLCGILSLPQMTVAAELVVNLAGNGKKGNSPDGSAAANNPIGEPYGLDFGPDGALYVCEIANHVIRRLDLKSGTMSVVAGNGEKGYDGDGGPAAAARLNEPYEVRFDSLGNLVFVEMKNAVIRRVDKKSGVIATIAGTGESGFSGDDGPATKAMLNQPHSIALDAGDNIYVCDIKNARIRRIDAKTGIISTLVGGGSRQLDEPIMKFDDLALRGPRALDYAGSQAFILALREGNAIYRLDLKTRTLTHLAGTGKKGYSGDGGAALKAQLSGPKGVAVATNGDIYFTDTESHTIRVIHPKTGIIETVVGDGKRGDGPVGNPHKCRLARPHGVCTDSNGNVYIGDSENHRVRELVVK